MEYANDYEIRKAILDKLGGDSSKVTNTYEASKETSKVLGGDGGCNIYEADLQTLENISVGSNIQEYKYVELTDNDSPYSITADEGYDGVKRFEVNVGIHFTPPTLENITITENGVYTPTEYGFYDVNVSVNPPLEEITVTKRGVYTPTAYGFSTVNVSINPELTLYTTSITDNGTYYAQDSDEQFLNSAFNEVTVAVPQPTLEELTVTSNGVYTPTEGGYSKVTVNVSGGGSVVGLTDGAKLGYSTFTQIPSLDYTTFTDMYNMFSNCSSLTSISLGDLPNLTNAGYMFSLCLSLTSVTLGDMPMLRMAYEMFYQCSSLTSVSLGDLPNFTYANSMFGWCKSLTSISLDLPNLSSAYEMFFYCSSLTSVSLGDLPKLTNANSMFYRCSSLQNLQLGTLPLINLTNWGLSSCTLLTVDSLVGLISSLQQTTTAYTCTIGTTNLNKLTAEQIQIATDKGWTLN